MSFYIYSGKLKDELVVVVLPKGSVEQDDPIYIFTEKKFEAFRTQGVSGTSDGEDRIVFYDGFHSYEATSKNNYKELSLTRKSATGGTAEINLTRQYDQPQIAVPSPSDHARIWTGAIDFHGWAKDESFIVVAPQGLGNKRPVVALWQWTKDDKGVAHTVSHGNDKQQSESGNPGKFSFKQRDYYTLDCQLTGDLGLQVTIKSPSNPEKVQKELRSSAIIPRAAEHVLTPPRWRQEKIALDCSLPNANPSLARITTPLPFPADLVETLSYSAAYVDQAGYLAKYAVKKFDKLNLSYKRLEEKADARATKITKLNTEVADLKTQNKTLTERIAKDQASAEKREEILEKKLSEANNLLHESEIERKKLQDHINALLAHIKEDEIKDKALADANKKHDQQDHQTIERMRKELKDARGEAKSLRAQLKAKTTTIGRLEDDLQDTQSRLGEEKKKVAKLTAELRSERTQNGELKTQLDAKQHKLEVAEKELVHLRPRVEALQTELAAEKKKYEELQKKSEETVRQLKEANQSLEISLGTAKAENELKDKTIETQQKVIKAKDGEIAKLQDMFVAELGKHNMMEESWGKLVAENRMLKGKTEKSEVVVSSTEVTV